MSNKKKRTQKKLLSQGIGSSPAHTNPTIVSEILESSQSDIPGRFAYLKTHWWMSSLILLFSLGVLGAGLKYMEEDAQRQEALPPQERNLLSKVNPFFSAPTPTPTPQLSKEYIYAGGKLVSVEDANANAAPPADLAVWRL